MAKVPGILDSIARSFYSYSAQSRYAVLCIATGFSLAAAALIVDKHRWVEFGTGGTPPTWRGYLRITKLRILRAFSDVDLTDASPLTSEGPQYLRDLPQRQGARPSINGWTLPQRQTASSSPPLNKELHSRLHNLIDRLSKAHEDVLDRELSKVEGRTTPAIYAKPNLAGRHALAVDRILGSEIAHVHPRENSLHVWLSEADNKLVISRGWGERFPFSVGCAAEEKKQPQKSGGMKIHPGFCFVYAPRTEEELDIIEQIVAAGVTFMTGKSIF